MAQTYTLDEAAEKLNLSVEDFKRRLRTEWTQIRPFRDGATLRFRTNDIDELARTYGLGSSDELPLADDSGPEPSLPDEIGISKSKPRGDDAPLKLDDSDETFVLAPDPAPKKKKGDSDVRLERPNLKKPAAADDEDSILTEEFELPSEGGSMKLSGKSGKLSSAKLKSDSGKMKPPEPPKKPAPEESDSSEFELSLEPDSDEFQLSLAPDSSEEVSLGDLPPSPPGGRSGINLNRPTDSGVSLEKKKPAKKDDSDDEIDFELSLDAPGTGMSSKKKLTGSSKKLQADSDSEFELSLDEPSDSGLDIGTEKKGDIFEATDFEIPALEDDSASEAVALEDSDTDVESSDFDLALDEGDATSDDDSASQVVALDDEDAPRPKKKKKALARGDDDDDAVELDDDDASSALSGVRSDDDDDYEVSEAADERAGAVAPPAKWGPWPAVMLFPTLAVMFVGALTAYEVLHSMFGYQKGETPASPLVSFLAEKAGYKTN